MSTPRHEDNCGFCKGEGVAAPLEPTPQDFYDTWHPKKSFAYRSIEEYWFEFSKAYAAAVSKNLQVAEEDLCPSCSNGISRCDCKPPVDYKTKADHLWRRHVRLGKKLQHKSIAVHKAESRIVELEKEIAALRQGSKCTCKDEDTYTDTTCAYHGEQRPLGKIRKR